jgi:hypothetical protein
MNQFVLDWEEGHPSRLMAQADGLGGHWGMIGSCADNAAKQAHIRLDQTARLMPLSSPCLASSQRFVCWNGGSADFDVVIRPGRSGLPDIEPSQPAHKSN